MFLVPTFAYDLQCTINKSSSPHKYLVIWLHTISFLHLHHLEPTHMKHFSYVVFSHENKESVTKIIFHHHNLAV